MRKFVCFDTGEIWTEDEIRFNFEGEPDLVEAYDSFEEYLEVLLSYGRQGEGGIVPLEDMTYIVHACGGEMDGEELFATDCEGNAVRYAMEHDNDHPLGVFITEDGKILENW